MGSTSLGQRNLLSKVSVILSLSNFPKMKSSLWTINATPSSTIPSRIKLDREFATSVVFLSLTPQALFHSRVSERRIQLGGSMAFRDQEVSKTLSKPKGSLTH
ncbi:hypothetical protein ACS0TY_036033 [Phlomoides rotata]